MQPRTRLIASLVVLLAIFMIGVTGFVVIEGVPIGDAAYWMTATLSTVGYGDIVARTWVGHVWAMVVIVLGVMAAAMTISFLQALIVSGELRRVLGRRKLLNRIQQIHGHVIVCGYGRMGRLIANDLKQRGRSVVVIEQDPERTSQMEEQGLLYILGDATEEEILVQAGVMRARGLVAVLPHDADNVYVTLTARGLRADLHIVTRAEQPGSEGKLQRAGADRVVSPHVSGATLICNMLTRPNVTDFFQVAAKGVDLEVDEVVVGDDSPVCDKSLRELELRQVAGVMVVAVKRSDGHTIYNPGPDEVIRCQDTLILIGPAGASAKLAGM